MLQYKYHNCKIPLEISGGNSYEKINIAVVGLNFGSCFAPIYACHPNVENVFVCDLNDNVLERFFKNHPYKNIFAATFEEILANDSIDAVHICTDIPYHAAHSLAVLKAKKHCCCAVPMGVSLDEIRSVVEETRNSGKNYMMAETTLFTAPFLTAAEMLENGEFGKVQFMRGSHYQPMDNGYWDKKKYWLGLPPMHYSTHITSPLRAIANSDIKKVIAIGSGTMEEHLVNNYGNPYPIEDAFLLFENGMKGEVVRGLFECAMKPTESFNIYGSKKCLLDEFDGEIIEKYNDEKILDAAYIIDHKSRWKNYYDRIPEEIRAFTLREGEKMENYKDHLDTAPLAVHEASHPHLCHEFICSILENRKAYVDEDFSANITAAGICAHDSAMQGGIPIDLPKF